MAGVGSPDRPLQPRHQRRAVLEAAPVPVHGALRRVRPLRAVAVDDHLGRDLAERPGVRLAGGLPARRRSARAPLRRLRRRPGRRAGRARDRPVHALDPQRRVGHDDRRAVPGGGRLHPLPALPVGVLGLVAGGAGPTGGVGPDGRLRGVGVALDSGHAPPDDRRHRPDPGPVAGHSGDQLQEPVLGRLAGRALAARAARQQDHRHLQPLQRPRRGVDQDRRADRRACWPPGAGPAGAAAGRRRGAVGGGGGRLRAARLAGRAPLHVRGRRRGVRAGRGVRRARDPRHAGDPGATADQRLPTGGRLGLGGGDRRVRDLAGTGGPRTDLARARRPESPARPHPRVQPAQRRGQAPRRLADPRLRAAQHPDRVPERAGLVPGHQHRRSSTSTPSTSGCTRTRS